MTEQSSYHLRRTMPSMGAVVAGIERNEPTKEIFR